MYKEACVLLKRAGWWDDFNDYADKNEWVRPAVGAGLLGLGGAGVGALTGGAKGAAIGGGAGLALGAGGGWLYDYLRKARMKQAIQNHQIEDPGQEDKARSVVGLPPAQVQQQNDVVNWNDPASVYDFQSRQKLGSM